MALLSQAETLVYRCLLRCSALEKIKNAPSHIVHPSAQIQTPSFRPDQARHLRSLRTFIIESFKVIALDKHSVNRNLCSCFRTSKSHESSSLCFKHIA
jgi:hypothetical protein